MNNLYEIGKTGTDVLVDAAIMVCWQFSLDAPCYPPGDFYQSVLHAMAKADHEHFRKLADGFPIHAMFIRMAQQEHDDRGREIIKAIARIGLGQAQAEPSEGGA